MVFPLLFTIKKKVAIVNMFKYTSIHNTDILAYLFYFILESKVFFKFSKYLNYSDRSFIILNFIL